MARWRNTRWNLHGNENDPTVSNANVQFALLMDIRDELQKLNRVLECPNFLAIPHKLDAIRRNTTKKRRRKVKP